MRQGVVVGSKPVHTGLPADIVEVRDGNVPRIACDQNRSEAQIGEKLLSFGREGQVQGDEASATDLIQAFFKSLSLYVASDAKARVLNTGKEPEAARQQVCPRLWYAVGQYSGPRSVGSKPASQQTAHPSCQLALPRQEKSCHLVRS